MMKLEDVIVRLDQQSLTKILTRAMVDTLDVLKPNSISQDKLADLIIKHIQKDVILTNPTIRKILINAMSEKQAKDFAIFLGIKQWENVHYAILQKTFTKKLLKKVFEFFDEEYEEDEDEDKKEYQSIEPERYLFPHQIDTVQKTRDMLEKSPHKVLLHMPTGSGKTISAIRIIISHMLENPSSLVIWLAHNEELCEQSLQEFQRTWKLAGDRKIDTYRFFGSNKLQLLSIKKGFVSASLSKMIGSAKKSSVFLSEVAQHTSFVVIDEAHMATADKFRKIIEELSLNDNTKLLGLSATPGRKSEPDAEPNEDLARFFSNNKQILITDKQNPIEFLTNKGYLAKATFNPIPYDTSNLSEEDIAKIKRSLDIPDEILKKISLITQRNVAIVREIERLTKKHKKIIMFASSIEHAQSISLILSSRNVNSHYLIGKTPLKTRRKMLNDYKNTDTPMVLCNYGVLTTGFDAPKTSAIVIARPTKSYVLYAQMVGRGIRGPKAGGNKECEISVIQDENIKDFIDMPNIFTQWEKFWNER